MTDLTLTSMGRYFCGTLLALKALLSSFDSKGSIIYGSGLNKCVFITIEQTKNDIFVTLNYSQQLCLKWGLYMGKASPLKNKSSNTGNSDSSLVTNLMLIWHLYFLQLPWKTHKVPSRIEKIHIFLKTDSTWSTNCLFSTGFSVTRDTFSLFSGKQSTQDRFRQVFCCH